MILIMFEWICVLGHNECIVDLLQSTKIKKSVSYNLLVIFFLNEYVLIFPKTY